MERVSIDKLRPPSNKGALTVPIQTILGVPSFNYSIIYPKALFQLLRPYSTLYHGPD